MHVRHLSLEPWSIDHSHERGRSLVRVSPLADLYVWLPFNSGECTVISLGEDQFLDLKVWLRKMDSWSGAQRQNLSVVIYHTLFSHNEERFHHKGERKKKRKKKREERT